MPVTFNSFNCSSSFPISSTGGPQSWSFLWRIGKSSLSILETSIQTERMAFNLFSSLGKNTYTCCRRNTQMVRTVLPWKSAFAYEIESTRTNRYCKPQLSRLLPSVASKEHNNMSEQMQPNLPLQKGWAHTQLQSGISTQTQTTVHKRFFCTFPYIWNLPINHARHIYYLATLCVFNA